VFVTHDLSEAFKLADKIAIFHHGKLEQVGAPHAIIHHPETAYVKQLIDQQRESLRRMNEALE
jgi:ABC-type proline/glycine betaine transport system ATPase subunit